MKDSIRVGDAVGVGLVLKRAAKDGLWTPEHGGNIVGVSVFHKNMSNGRGAWEDLGVWHNSRVDAGASWLAGIMGNATAAASAQYIALTTDATAVAKGDTTLASEETTNGLARAIASYGSYTAPATLNGAASYIMSKTFTYTGSSSKVIAKAGMFNATSSGTLVFETLFGATATVNNNGDQIAVTWTVNI